MDYRLSLCSKSVQKRKPQSNTCYLVQRWSPWTKSVFPFNLAVEQYLTVSLLFLKGKIYTFVLWKPLDIEVCLTIYISLFFLLLRYLGSKAVKLFKVRMHGSDAVSTFSDVASFFKRLPNVNSTVLALPVLGIAGTEGQPTRTPWIYYYWALTQ